VGCEPPSRASESVGHEELSSTAWHCTRRSARRSGGLDSVAKSSPSCTCRRHFDPGAVARAEAELPELDSDRTGRSATAGQRVAVDPSAAADRLATAARPVRSVEAAGSALGEMRARVTRARLGNAGTGGTGGSTAQAPLLAAHAQQYFRIESAPAGPRAPKLLFVGSDDGGITNARFVSLLASARLQSIEPLSYMRDLLCLLPSWPKSRVLELAPAYWKRPSCPKLKNSWPPTSPGACCFRRLCERPIAQPVYCPAAILSVTG
jgi:hypothetical protein